MYDFAIAGFPKCGTSSLLAVFAQAGLQMVTPEPNLRDILRTAHWRREGGYALGFKSAVLAHRPDIIKRLYEANPRFRVLIGLRDPVEWAWSWYWFQRRNVEDVCRPGGPRTAGGKNLFGTRFCEPRRLSKITALDFVRCEVNYPSLNRGHGNFHKFLEGVYAGLPADRVLIYDVSQLRRSWTKVVARCLSFVEEGRSVPPPIRRNVNRGKPRGRMNRRFRVAGYEYYQETYQRTAQLLEEHGYTEISRIFATRAQNRGGDRQVA